MSEVEYSVVDLGAVTAYAQAVENGYTGTLEQWAQLQINSANNYQELFNEIYTKDSSAALWEQGGLSASTGNTASSTTRIRTTDYLPDSVAKIVMNTGYYIMVYVYGNDGTFIGVLKNNYDLDGNERTVDVVKDVAYAATCITGSFDLRGLKNFEREENEESHSEYYPYKYKIVAAFGIQGTTAITPSGASNVTFYENNVGHAVDNDLIGIGENEPDSDRAVLWIDKDGATAVHVPEIDDEHISDVDTWSSEKINSELGQISEEIDDTINAQNATLNPVLVLGKGIGTNGAIGTSAKRMATEEFIDVHGYDSIEYSIDSGYRMSIAFYSAASESAFVSVRYWITGSGRLRNESNYIRVTYSTVAETEAITLAEAAHFTLSVRYPILNTLDTNTDKCGELTEATNGGNVNVPLKFKQGTGSSFAKNRIFAGLIDVTAAEEITINVVSGMRYYITYTDASGTSIVGRGWYTDAQTIVPEYGYFYIALAYTDDAELWVGDFTDSMLSVTIKWDKLGIPPYWKKPLANAISSIQSKELLTDAGGDSFVFITDTHWNENAQKSPALIKHILEKTNVKKVFFGGDVLTLYSSQAKALEVGRSFYEAFGDIPVYSSLGNHDLNNNQGTYGQDAYLNYPIVYSYMFKRIENEVEQLPHLPETNGDGNRNLYYFIDNAQQKIRYIVLNNGKARIGNVQTPWLKARLTELQTGWTAVIFVHEYWFGLSGTTPVEVVQGTDIETAINDVYDSMNGTVAALIVGHCHYDYSKTAEKGYKIISTTTDAYRLPNATIGAAMEIGTATEQAFDVFSIDTTNRKIYATRVGAGESREFTY